jgi:hypothetical protein
MSQPGMQPRCASPEALTPAGGCGLELATYAVVWMAVTPGLSFGRPWS